MNNFVVMKVPETELPDGVRYPLCKALEQKFGKKVAMTHYNGYTTFWMETAREKKFEHMEKVRLFADGFMEGYKKG